MTTEEKPLRGHKSAEHVKRGVWEAGGLPLDFPASAASQALFSHRGHAVDFLTGASGSVVDRESH